MCDARAPEGDLTPKFVLYDPNSKTHAWVTKSQERRVSREWQPIDLYFSYDGTKRVRLRIDVQEPATVPSFLLVRKLIILLKAQT